ncbi:IS607 family transposase [Ileibacterium valens]|uniref:IS607 family transposase n=2 Tax=Ileibacterium valens TaxID=1862668 RepID=UPI0034E53F45
MSSLTVETANSYCKMALRGVYDQIFGFNQRVLFNRRCRKIGRLKLSLNYGLEKQGRIKMAQSSTGRWYVSKQDVIEWLNSRLIYFDDSHKERINVIYATVSSHDQKKNGDLDRQLGRLALAASEKGDFKVFSDTDSGLNTTRKGLSRMLDLIEQDQVKTVFITHKDRLTRFGFEFIERLCKEHGTDIVILESREDKNAQEELAEDLMSLIALFQEDSTGFVHQEEKNWLFRLKT